MMKLTDFQEYNNAMTTYSELTTQLDEAERALNEASRLSSQEIEADNLDSMAMAMLDGSVFEDIRKTRQAEVSVAEKHVRVLKRAVEMQLQRVQTARGDASRQICEELATKYATIVKTYIGALRALHDAIQSEQRFFDELEGENVHSRFERYSLLSESNFETMDRITRLLTEIKRSGYKI